MENLGDKLSFLQVGEVFELFNDVAELIYITDVATNELLVMNTAGQKAFGLDDYQGKLCYEALQGRSSPCPFCTNPVLSFDRVYTWEHTNEITNRHFLLKDKLIHWGDKTARIEIAFDTTEQENEKKALTEALKTELTIMECIKELSNTNDLQVAFRSILNRLGNFFKADRTYMFEIRDGRMYNTYEWCAPGIEPEINLLQDLDESLIDRWREPFAQQQCVIIGDLEDVRDSSPDEYSVLSAQGITSLVAVPMEQDGVLMGYIGVDNPPKERIQNVSPLFQTLSKFLSTTIRIHEDEKKLTRLSYYDLLTGAFNRNRYLQDIDALAKRDVSLGMVYLDVNGLKHVNDTLGHACGDMILTECARKAVSVFGQESLYRVGGDEFIVFCPEIQEAAFMEFVLRLQALFRQPNSCSVAIGFQWADSTREIDTLTLKADAMMYDDKRRYYRESARQAQHHYLE